MAKQLNKQPDTRTLKKPEPDLVAITDKLKSKLRNFWTGFFEDILPKRFDIATSLEYCIGMKTWKFFLTATCFGNVFWWLSCLLNKES